MANKNGLSELEIASKLRAGKSFIVPTNKDRKRVLAGAKFFGVRVKTMTTSAGSFEVLFCK